YFSHIYFELVFLLCFLLLSCGRYHRISQPSPTATTQKCQLLNRASYRRFDYSPCPLHLSTFSPGLCASPATSRILCTIGAFLAVFQGFFSAGVHQALRRDRNVPITFFLLQMLG